MSSWQVVEKSGFGTAWDLVRYNENALQRLPTQDDAMKVAKQYLTEVNCNNALTKDEKRNQVEAFMMTDEGCYLGCLDGEEWFMLDRKGQAVKDLTYFELNDKAEVKVREIPGS